MITNHAIEKLSIESESVLIEVTPSLSGQTNIVEKDINDMVLAGHDVMSVLKLNTYSGLQAKIKFNNWKRYEQRYKGRKEKWKDRTS